MDLSEDPAILSRSIIPIGWRWRGTGRVVASSPAGVPAVPAHTHNKRRVDRAGAGAE